MFVMAPSLSRGGGGRRRSEAGADAYRRGNEAAQTACLEEAEAAYREALRARPDFAEAHNNLGNVLMRSERWDAAVAAYRSALAHGLVHPLVFYNLGTALRRTGEAAAAERHFAAALAMTPEYAEAWNNLGNLWRENARPDSAGAAYLRALRLRPEWEDAHDNLSGALYLLHDRGGRDDAVALAAVWLARHPDHPQARHLGAALSGATGDDRASDAYVRQVFDSFADSFDKQLEELGYRAPALLAAMIRENGVRGNGVGSGIDVLDAGCGTGLCGPLLKPAARRLDGVDLSAGMLERARARGGYDELVEAELTEFLTGRPDRYDLIVAADVFCYFGDMGPALNAAASCLRRGGRFAFSVERLSGDAPERWRLLPHGRYAHRADGLIAQVRASGLSIIETREDTLREESGEPVAGLLILAERPGLIPK